MSDAKSDSKSSWQMLLSVVKSMEEQILAWEQSSLLTSEDSQKIRGDFSQVAELYSLSAENGAAFPRRAFLLPLQPQETDAIRAFRTAKYLGGFLAFLRSRGTLSLSTYYALRAELRSRLTVLERQLLLEGNHRSELESQCVEGDPSEEALSSEYAVPRADGAPLPHHSIEPSQSRRNILDIILDPRSIQCLLGLGGALMVVGLVILLWLNNVFTPPVLAILLAVSNITLLSGGLATMHFTRYQLAGKALSLLSCLVMPLNLWYLHANNLSTIDGNLWMGAVVICVLYGLAAVMLKDELFVYVFTAGVTMTGLLILTSLPPSPQKFWEIASPATLLVVLGLIGIHLERAFDVGTGPFSRRRFGMAFFWSGQIQLAAGLLLVLGAQVAGTWLYPFGVNSIYASLKATPSPICGELRWLALALVAAGTYAYAWSDLVVRKKGIFLHIAAFALLWLEVLVVQILDLPIGVDAIIAILAATSILSHVAQRALPETNQFTRSLPAFGLLPGMLPVVIGLVVFLDHFGVHAVWVDEPPRWTFVGAMLLTALASRLGAHQCRKTSLQLTYGYFFATAATTMVAALAALAAMGLNQWQSHAPIMMLIPIAYLVASRLYADRSPATPLLWAAHAAAALMLISSLASSWQSLLSAENGRAPLLLTLYFAEAALFYGLATYFRRHSWCIYLSALTTCAALWQLLNSMGLETQGFILTFAVIGLLMLIACRLSLPQKTVSGSLSEALLQAANAVLSLAFISSVFFGMSRFASHSSASVDWNFASFCFAMLSISGISFIVTKHPSGRNWYSVTTIAQSIVLSLAVHRLIDLSPAQQIELFCVLSGLILLVIGHLGWFKEQDQQSDLVSTSLLFGSLLASLPLAIATLIDRSRGHFLPLNELGFLAISIALLATGVLFQLKFTTVVGSGMTILYFVTLALFVPWGSLNIVALAIITGGGIVFGSGLVLAVFRDRLLTLPNRIRQREGIFRVLSWR
jgi:hypothetical protein